MRGTCAYNQCDAPQVARNVTRFRSLLISIYVLVLVYEACDKTLKTYVVYLEFETILLVVKLLHRIQFFLFKAGLLLKEHALIEEFFAEQLVILFHI